MPFPIGHAAIGLAVFETAKFNQGCCSRWARVVFVALLANLPDLDILCGLVLVGNGSAYHRGPTHSLFFAVLCGYLASHLWRLRPGIPKVGFGLCSLLIFSHVVADMILTTAPVSLFWPLEIHWCQGHSSWFQVVDMVLFQSIQDGGIVIAALLYGFALRAIRGLHTEDPCLPDEAIIIGTLSGAGITPGRLRFLPLRKQLNGTRCHGHRR